MKQLMSVLAVLAVVAVAMLIDQALGNVCGIGGMMAVMNLIATAHPRLENFAYPSTARVLVLQDDLGEIHDIWVPVDVSALLTATYGTGYGNAPVGSRLTQYIAGTTTIYVKETDATWTEIT